MDLTEIYATSIASMFFASVILSGRRLVIYVWDQNFLPVFKYFAYSYLIRRHRFIGPLTPAFLLIVSFYVTANVFCLTFRAASLMEAATRAGQLSLINLLLPLAGFHLSFLADFTGLSLKDYKTLHQATGLMSLLLGLIHVLILAQNKPFSLGIPENLFGLVGILSLCFLSILFNQFLQRVFYEIVLRVHQAVAILLVYSLWHHTPSNSISKLYLCVIIGLCSFTFAIQCGHFLFRNSVFRARFSRASISQKNNLVEINLKLSRPTKVRPGQYINLWIPSVSFWSFVQTHPFMVTSWTEDRSGSLDLLVIPRKGFTRELLRHTNSDAAGSSSRLVAFSGPHGRTISVKDYESVLMVASGSGIAAQLPYLRQLIHHHNSHKTYTRRVHLVWCLETNDIGLTVEPLIQQVLEADTCGYILNVSIYHRNIKTEEYSFGEHAMAYKGLPNLKSIINEETDSKKADWGPDARLLIMGKTSLSGRYNILMDAASCSNNLRDQLHRVARDYISQRVTLMELGYQPVDT